MNNLLALPHLPPPPMPSPFSYEAWIKNISDLSPACKKCESTRKHPCPECNGIGETECCECEQERECKDCNGTGAIDCKCVGDLSRNAYITAITSDYEKLLFMRGLTMPTPEIRRIAWQNAKH